MLANLLQFLDRKASAERRFGGEPDVRDHVLVARMHASVVAVDFILRSLEHIGTAKKLILGKNIAILSNRDAVYFPRGRYPARTLFQPLVVEVLALQDARSRRLAAFQVQLSREHYVQRKSLGRAVVVRLQDRLTSSDVNFQTCVLKYPVRITSTSGCR